MPNQRVPEPSVERLATYLVYLSKLGAHGIETISSAAMAARTGINAAQFRKDLSHFGEFGRPGIGYNVRDLTRRIARILKVEHEQSVLLVGAGNLGSAIVGYAALKAQNFHIVAVFDNNPDKIGRRLWGLRIQDISNMKNVNKELRARIGIITVPAEAAQGVAEALVEADIRAILNFAPVTLKLPSGVVARSVDFVQELAVLSFYAAGETTME